MSSFSFAAYPTSTKHSPPHHPPYPSRPCLKRSQPNPCPTSELYPIHISIPDAHPHVHFPPTPTLHQTFPTHSKRTYDRTPLVVVPNTCAMPARGAPGRTYVDSMIKDEVEIEETDDAEAEAEALVAKRSSFSQLIPNQNPRSSYKSDALLPSNYSTPSTSLTFHKRVPNDIVSALDSMKLDFLPQVRVGGRGRDAYRHGYSMSPPEDHSHSISRSRSGSWSRSRSRSRSHSRERPKERERQCECRCSRELERERRTELDAVREGERERTRHRREKQKERGNRRERGRHERGRWKSEGLKGVFPSAGGVEMGVDEGCFGGF